MGRNWQRPVDERFGVGYAFKLNPTADRYANLPSCRIPAVSGKDHPRGSLNSAMGTVEKGNLGEISLH
jgi:hypothetical protein